MTVYSMTTVVGTSGTSVSDAIRGAVERACQTYDDVQWFEVKETRGAIRDGEPEYQVTLELGRVLPAENGENPRESVDGSRQARSTAAQEAASRGERGRSDLAKGFEQRG